MMQSLVDLVDVPVLCALYLVQNEVLVAGWWALLQEAGGGGRAVDGGLEVVEVL